MILSKKGLAYESYLATVVVVIMFLTASVAYYNAVGFSNNVRESAPDISYEYPKVLINTFLMQDIDLEDSREVFSDDSDYIIRDLLWEGSSKSLDLAREYSEDYLLEVDRESGNEAKELYERFSKTSGNNIIISKIEEPTLSEEEILSDYSYVLITKDEQYIKISYGRS